MGFRRIADLGDLSGKRALVRVDLNVPMQDGRVTDDTRLKAVRPTVEALLKAGGSVLLLAHFGRPGGQVVPEMSLEPVVPALSTALERPVVFADYGDDIPAHDIVVLENTRYQPGEEKNDPDLARLFASLGDVYVNDAFSAAHRAHASTEGIAHLLPCAAGETMAAELDALEAALGAPQRPVAAVVGGAKVSTKLAVLENLVTKVDHLIIGGGMANTFLLADGKAIGASLAEADMLDTVRAIRRAADTAGCTLHLPVDGVVARIFKAGAENRISDLSDIADDEMILDIGPQSASRAAAAIKNSATLLWNGPMGAFEITPFDRATVDLAKVAGEQTAAGKLISVAGGGDTVAALAHAGVKAQFRHISTAGGAFLEWMEGRPLPGVDALMV